MGTFQNFLTAIVILLVIIIIFGSSFYTYTNDSLGTNVTGIPPTWIVIVIAIVLIFIIQKPRVVTGWFRKK